MFGCNRRSNIFNYFILFIFGLFLSASASAADLEVEEYSVTSLFTVEKLGEFLNIEGVVQKDREGYIYIIAPDYSSSILRWEGDYFYYANMYPTKSLNTVAKAIFREHSLKGWFSYGKGIFRIKMLASPDQEKTKYPAVPSVLAAINDGLDYENHHNILHFIVKEGSLGSIKYFLTEKKLDPNVQDGEGLTPLMLALHDGKDEIAQEFINLNNIHFEIEDNEGKTVLMIAKELGRTKIAKEIQRKIYKRQRWTDLMIAASKNDLVWVKGLLVRGDDPLVRDKDGQNAFMIARKLEHLDIAEEIKSHVCEIKVWTELMFAVDANNIEMVRALLARDDVDPTIRNKDGKTALNMAKYSYGRKYGYVRRIAEEIKKSIFKKKGWDELMIAVDDNDIEKVKVFLIRGNIDLKRRNNEGQTAYDMALEREYKEIEKEITSHKNFKYPVKFSREMLRFAIKDKISDIAEDMISHDNFDPNFQDVRGWTDLMFALHHDDLESARRIINKDNFDPNIKNEDDWTALGFALDHDQVWIAKKVVMNKNFDPNVKHANDCGMVSFAIKKGFTAVANEIAMHKDHNHNVRDSRGCCSDLEFALLYNQVWIAKNIVRHKNFDPNLIGAKTGATDFVIALYNYPNLSVARMIMRKEGFDPNMTHRQYGRKIISIARFALILGYSGIAKEIVMHKDYNPNLTFGDYETTDLMYALREGQDEFAREIIKKDNFDPNVKNKEGNTAFGIALDYKYNDIAIEIMRHRNFDPKANSKHLSTDEL